MNSFDTFTLAPLSAGDIIDRAVRLYRRNFLALLRIVLGPSLVAYTGTVLYDIGIRNFSLMRGEGRIALSLLLVIGGFGLWALGTVAFYAVLGGASRSLVDHFFEGKPILARDVYRLVRQRFWSLIGMVFMVGLLLMGTFMVLYFVVAIMAIAGVMAAPLFAAAPNWLQAVLLIGFSGLIALLALFVLLLVYSRLVFIPQVMMVEGKGVFNAISRSFTLAGHEIWRIAALLLFWIYVAWSLLSLLLVPVASVAYWMGADFNVFNQGNGSWMMIAYQTLTQVSGILIAPIALLGFTLLYLDSRVRKEGFDVELLANRLMPPTPEMLRSPPPPMAFSASVAAEPAGFGKTSILGLNDYGPIRQSTIEPLPMPVPPIEMPSAMVLPAVTVEEEIEPVAAGFTPAPVPAEGLGIVPAIKANFEANIEPVAVPETMLTENEAALSVDQAAPRACRWCGTLASGEDRFCRVCGSVF